MERENFIQTLVLDIYGGRSGHFYELCEVTEVVKKYIKKSPKSRTELRISQSRSVVFCRTELRISQNRSAVFCRTVFCRLDTAAVKFTKP